MDERPPIKDFDAPVDTIVAPATPRGRGAVAIVRWSGPASLTILRGIFRPFSPSDADAWPPPARRLLYGAVTDGAGAHLDDALAVSMPGPHSFTGEDVVELQLHGGPAVVDAVMATCTAAGARLAEPGEFTRRAFLNGRLDLARAEAVADLISAESEAARRVALRGLRGGLSRRIGDVRIRLLDLAAEVEARLDFAEDEVPPLANDVVEAELSGARVELAGLLGGFQRGRLAREGARVVVAGRPNVGKSSLFNALVGRERSIVTPHAGTTRDTVEATLDLRGIAVTFVDTAGLRDTHDEAERLGVERAAEEMETADAVVFVVDASQIASATGAEIETMVSGLNTGRPSVVVLNKADLVPADQLDGIALALGLRDRSWVAVSALRREGLDSLETVLAEMLGTADGLAEDAIVANARHADCLDGAVRDLDTALASLQSGQPGEVVMVDTRGAIVRLGEILGIGLGDELLDRIFSRFCLGK